MNSVERIKEYLDVEQEAERIIEKNRPPENWPSQGSVEFINYTTSYRKELEPVLRNLTFKIDAKEKVGDATDNQSLQAEGVGDQASGKAKQAAADIKQAGEDITR